MPAPICIYVVHHLKSEVASKLASELFNWFKLSLMTENQNAAGVPVYFRRQIDKRCQVQPEISLGHAELNVIVLLVDQEVVGDIEWRTGFINLADQVNKWNKRSDGKNEVLLLPIAMHEGLYRMTKIYECFNPVRLIDFGFEQMVSFLRRAVTEASARILRRNSAMQTPPLDVFLSHAKRDGRHIAEYVRDSIRSFGQMVAWYDANDLPFGGGWKPVMTNAASNDTAAMVAAITDTYPSRQWCRREATVARTPRRVNRIAATTSGIWAVQPVVGVYELGSKWTRPLPMLEGVPRIGWNALEPQKTTELLVDRLALEVMLSIVNRKVALSIARRRQGGNEDCYLTWVPDCWTLSQVRQQMINKKESVDEIRWIIHPGYGLTETEEKEIEAVVKSFHQDAKLISFEEVM